MSSSGLADNARGGPARQKSRTSSVVGGVKGTDGREV
jgi:hypothetical protein